MSSDPLDFSSTLLQVWPRRQDCVERGAREIRIRFRTCQMAVCLQICLGSICGLTRLADTRTDFKRWLYEYRLLAETPFHLCSRLVPDYFPAVQDSSKRFALSGFLNIIFLFRFRLHQFVAKIIEKLRINETHILLQPSTCKDC